MQENYATTKLPTAAATNDTGHTSPGAVWQNPSRITAADGSSATWGAYLPGQASNIVGSSFGFPSFPDGAVIDGIEVYISGSQVGCFGDVYLNIAGSTSKSIGSLNGSYGGPTDLWGKTSITEADILALQVAADTADVSGGDGSASMDYMQVTVYWHIDITGAPADVPTRVAYKVYSRDGSFLGELPKVTSPFVFPQDINSAGSSIEITCGVRADNQLTTANLITGDGLDITTGTGAPITVTTGTTMLARGEDTEPAIFKNGNRVKIWIYNYWYPNGKLMFSGQMNKVKPKFAGGKIFTKVTVLSDGLDLNNLVARGYPFNYTNDVVQTTENTYATCSVSGPKGAGWNVYGQSFVAGGSVSNIGAISLLLRGTANVTVILYDAPNGNLLGSATKSVSVGAGTEIQFEFPSLIDVNPNGSYFFGVWVDQGQSIDVFYSASSVYTDGRKYNSNYDGGSGGGSWAAEDGDLWFKTKSGTPTTTATYSTQDPVTGMMRAILTDYNNRGGYVTEGNFVTTDQSLTYTFNMAFVFDAMRKVLDMSPSGYVAYIDLGTAEMDIFPMSQTPDFTIVNGTDTIDVDLELSIEQVKNYLLLTGGEVTPGVNLYRDYKDSSSDAAFGTRTGTKSDNRMTVTATADAVGNSYIAENADEAENLTIAVPVTAMDTTLLTPGKVIGFKNYGNFMDTIMQAIVRREWHNQCVVLTLGKMPVRMNDEIQRINRELLNEQTANNPTAPS